MRFLIASLILSWTPELLAQIADASFFPSVKTINPGVVHNRLDGFMGLDLGKKNVEKKHDVPLGGIIGGIKTDVDLTKGTFYRAGKGKGITVEVLLDHEQGTKTEKIRRPSDIRTIKNEASSTYYGGVLDLKYFGISYAGANYNFTDKFRIGEPPMVSAKDQKQDLNYTNLKIGSAIKYYNFRLGAYYLQQKAKGDYSYTFFDPATGNRGTTEKFPVTIDGSGYGVGLGWTSPKLRLETSYEGMSKADRDISDSYPAELPSTTATSRLSLVGEIKFSRFAIGGRVRQYRGNFVDLEDIISSNLLYGSLGKDDTRLETALNFTLGKGKGLSFSGYFSTSKVNSEEESPVFSNGEKYKAVTTSQAFGVNVSYIY